MSATQSVVADVMVVELVGRLAAAARIGSDGNDLLITGAETEGEMEEVSFLGGNSKYSFFVTVFSDVL